MLAGERNRLWCSVTLTRVTSGASYSCRPQTPHFLTTDFLLERANVKRKTSARFCGHGHLDYRGNNHHKPEAGAVHVLVLALHFLIILKAEYAVKTEYKKFS
jgi:hypothetical protein